MNEYLNFAYWLFQPQAWIILGIVLVIADIFLGYTLFVLPFGVSAFIMSAMIYADRYLYAEEMNLLPDWKRVLIYYAGLSIVAIFLIKKIFQKKIVEQKDINDY